MDFVKTQAQQNVFSDARIEEAKLVRQVREGNDDALRDLVDRHRLRLIRTAANILRDPMEAEDVAQDAFLKAFRELHRLRDDRAFASFIYRICVRLCVDRLRLKRAEPSALEPTERTPQGSIETRVLIERLLDKLQPDLRATLVLREMEQMSYEEVARLMDVPIGTVRSRLHTAREKFRALWITANEMG